MRVSVLGGGAWGTALAISLAARHEISLWTRNPVEAGRLDRERQNARYLPGFPLPQSICIDAELPKVCRQADLLLAVVPSAGFRATLRELAEAGIVAPLVWASKGFETGSMKLLHQVAAEEWDPGSPVGVLSGPSFAREVAAGLPTALTLASTHVDFAHATAAAIHSTHLRVYTSTDVIGVEVGGAVKNVMAIAAGISDGLGFGYNARAALITRGLAEITRLGVALGGHPETFMGLTGAGDLILTCTGDLSRNRTVGLRLAKGETLEHILAALGHIAEGVTTALEVRKMAREHGVDMPITEAVCKVLYEDVRPLVAVEALLNREQKAENAH